MSLQIDCCLPTSHSQSWLITYNLGATLFTRRQQQHPRGDDRDRITKARREAEALFTSKPPIRETAVSHPQTPIDQAARKPRILTALSTTPVRQQEDAAQVSTEAPITPIQIPSSQFARIRAWIKYGMTAAQVAGCMGLRWTQSSAFSVKSLDIAPPAAASADTRFAHTR